MSIAITVAGSSVNIFMNSLKITDQVGARSTCTFDVLDNAGTLHIQNGAPVTVTDSVNGLLFAGFVDQGDENNLFPNVNNRTKVTAKDNHYLADKRRVTRDYTNMQAGDIVTDMLSSYLAAEGVTAGYSYRRDTTNTDFGTGTLTGVSATSNVGDGDLELSLAGSSLTSVTNTTAQWAAGTLTSTVAANNQLVLKSRNGIALSGNNNGNQGSNAYVYWCIWQGSYTIASGDLLTYKVWVNAASPAISGAMDFECTDGTTLSTYKTGSPAHYLGDQNAVSSPPSFDLRGFADNQWYYRYIDLTPLAGKVISTFYVAIDNVAGGNYAAYFFDNKITDSTGTITHLQIYNNDGNLNASFQGRTIGFSNVSVTTPLVYDTPGTRISPATSLTSVGIAKSSLITYTDTVPTNTTVEIDTSFDGGATWQAAASRAAIPALIAGASLSGVNLMTRQVLTITGNDPIVTPAVSSLSATITPSYSATKNDVLDFANTTAQWNALGTNVGGISIGNALTLSNWRRNWDDANLGSQTLFGNASPVQGPNNKRMYVQTNSGTDVRSRQDWAGNTWQNFTVSVDVQIPSFASDSVGIEYRTTNWGNGNNSGAWHVEVSQSVIQIGYGANNGAGTTQGFTLVQSFSGAGFAPVAGSVHTLTLTVNGSSHQVWLDGVRYINATDSTYSGNAGYVAVRGYNTSGVNTAYFFDNFGVGGSPGTTGTWQTNNISLNTLATVGDSFIAWQQEVLPAGCSLLVQSTIDGGTTWTTCTSGAEIPLLIPGTNVVGKNLQVKITFTASSLALTPTLDGLMIWVTSNFSSSGNRISPALSLGTVGRAGATSLSWNALLPSGCTLGMDVGTAAIGPWTDVTSGNGQPLPASIIYTQPDPYLDFFASNSSANYTSTDYASGGGGTTALTVYGNQDVSGTLGTADQLTINSAGTTSAGVSTKIGTSTGWGEIPAVGSAASWPALGSIGSPSGNGWLLDNTSLEAQQILAGNWQWTEQARISNGTATIDMVVRYYKRSSGGVYTSIGAITLSAQAYTTTFTTYTSASTALGSMSFATGDKLYKDVWINISTNGSGNSTATYIIRTCNNVGQGKTGIAQTTTPGYQPVASPGTWTWDTANNRLIGSGGVSAVLQYSGFQRQDMYAEADFNYSDGGGLFIRMTDANHLYYLVVNDASTSSNPNTLKLFSFVTGTSTQLGATQTIAFTRGDYRHIRLDAQGTTISVMFDGVQLLSVTDASISGAGYAGFADGNKIQALSLRVQPYGDNVASMSLYTRQRLASTNPLATTQLLDMTLSVHDPNIGNGVLIPSTSYAQIGSNMNQVSQCLDDLANQSNYAWYVGNKGSDNLRMFFHKTTERPAPWYAWSGSASANILVAGPPTVSRPNMLYRNRQTVDGGLSPVSVSGEKHYGDGITQTWLSAYPVAQSTVPPSVTLNGQPQKVGVQGVDTGKDFYYTVGSNVWTQDPSEIPPAGNGGGLSTPDVIALTYTGQEQVRVTVNNTNGTGIYAGTIGQTQLAAIDSTSGIVEDYISMPGISQSAATTQGQQLLQQYGVLSLNFTFQTNRYGLAPGQLLSMSVPQHQIVNQPFFISKISTSVQQVAANANQYVVGNILYTYAVEVTNGPAIIGSWVKLFQKMLTNKAV